MNPTGRHELPHGSELGQSWLWWSSRQGNLSWSSHLLTVAPFPASLLLFKMIPNCPQGEKKLEN